MKFKGDHGNYVTTHCLCESALALLLNREDLPACSEDGVGTPGEVLGGVFLKRLQTAKVQLVQVTTDVRKNEDCTEWMMHS
jgi:hypothetical protein